MSGKRFPDEFKPEGVLQVVDRSKLWLTLANIPMSRRIAFMLGSRSMYETLFTSPLMTQC